MARRQITISSIFAGQQPSQNFGSENEFFDSIGIDPEMPTTDAAADIKTSGLIRPVRYTGFSSTEVDSAVIGIVNEPHSDNTWVALANGKIVLYTSALTSGASQAIGQVTGNNATGFFYYNNHLVVTGTETTFDDMAAIGPLNTLPYDNQTENFVVGETLTGGTSGATANIIADVDGGASGTLTLDFIKGFFTDNETITGSGSGSATVARTNASLITNAVWTGSLFGTQNGLTNWTPPVTLQSVKYLSHHGISHTDGAAYVLDYKQGLGFIHKIQTKRTTNEGDTDDGSAFQSVGSLSLPKNYIPITLSSFGTDIVVASTKTFSPTISQGGSLLSFWNAADELFYRHVAVSDPICTALIYANGILYGLSGSLSGGYRLWRYVGGDSVETLKVMQEGRPPMQNAIASIGNRIVWAADTTLPFVSSGLYGYASRSGLFPSGLHNIAVSDFE